MARDQPGRLVGLATAALQHPGLAAEQLAEAVGKLGLRGVEISTSAAGRDLSDPFEPFFAAAASLGAFIFIHPWGCSLGERLNSWYLGNMIGQPAETTLALSHLIFGGVLDRHPDLIVCGAHGGGYLPQYVGRADHAYAVRPESAAMKQPPSAYLRQLYFDSLVYTPGTASQLIDAAGPGHVLLGTDYPSTWESPTRSAALTRCPGCAAMNAPPSQAAQRRGCCGYRRRDHER
jgi:aminocarboxymuconate-semialdehyde decarboxylase